MIGDRLRLEDAVDQFLHDDPVQFLSLVGARAQVFEPVRRKLFWIDLAPDEPARAEQAEAVEAAHSGFFSDDLGDMQPRERRARCDKGKSLPSPLDREACLRTEPISTGRTLAHWDGASGHRMLIPGKVCSRRHGPEFCCFEGVDAVVATAGISALLPMAES
jgi:hypothetical protein